MPEQNSDTREVEHAEKGLDVTFPTGDEPPEVVQQAKRRSIFQRRRVRRRHRPSLGLWLEVARAD